MCWMILHPKLLDEHLCHSLGGPDCSCKPMGFCPLLQQRWKTLELLWAQSGFGSLRDFPSSSLFSLLSADLHPLADGPLRDS
jgi:hypothetical protein